MKVWLKDLHKIIADAKKLGVSGKGTIVKIYPDVNGDTQGTTYTITLEEDLNKDLDMWLTLKFLQQYLKPMKKCGGAITYNHTNYLAKFTYDNNSKLQAGLLGVRPPQGSR